MTSAPVPWLHMIGNKAAMVVAGSAAHFAYPIL
jgi:hypothetical protein